MHEMRSYRAVGIVIAATAVVLAILLVILFMRLGDNNRDLGRVAVELCERATSVAEHERQVSSALTTLGRATTIIAEPMPGEPPPTERGMRFLREVQRFNRIVAQIEPAPEPEDCSLESILTGGPIIEESP